MTDVEIVDDGGRARKFSTKLIEVIYKYFLLLCIINSITLIYKIMFHLIIRLETTLPEIPDLMNKFVLF